MKGSILEFNLQRSEGVISGDDGRRYAFVTSDWKADGVPHAGQKVDFVTGEGAEARDIYVATASPGGSDQMSGSMKKAIIAIICAVLAFFIPVVGVVLAIAGLMLGRQARSAAKAEADDSAALVAMIAIVVAAIALFFAAIALVSLVLFGSGLALLGSGALL